MSTATETIRDGGLRLRVAQLVLACAAALALAGVAAAASGQPQTPTQPGDLLDPRTYAPESGLFLSVDAVGVQKYTCQPNGTWLFTAPEATLFKTSGRPHAIGDHYLNVATGRPVWRFKDGSTVEAARTQTAPGGAGNIALLLLQAVATAAGPDGDRLAGTTWVQRLGTSGGVAPAGSCTAGDEVAVPYTTEYHFWRAKPSGQER
jgi:hypothetical protein